MLSMEILSLFLLSFSLTSAQQWPGIGNYNNGNYRFQNPVFRSIQTPMMASATKDKSYISIPIVLMPDGRPLQKPKQSSYQFVGLPTQTVPRPSESQRGNRQRIPKDQKPSATTFHVAIPTQPKKADKPPKLTAAQLNVQTRSPALLGKQRVVVQSHQLQQQQSQPQKSLQSFDQSQQGHQVQFPKQQRGQSSQPATVYPSQQVASAHKQNVANFVNFATSLGSVVASPQQNPHVILPTSAPAASHSLQNQAHLKTEESYQNQRQQAVNPKSQSTQYQVPNPQTVQIQYAQVTPNSVVNFKGYTFPQQPYSQHHQQLQQQLNQHHQQQQQQQQQKQESQKETTQQNAHAQGSVLDENQYVSTANIRSNVQTPTQSADLQNNIQYQGSQAFQQGSVNNARTQSVHNNGAVPNSYIQSQQGNQNYAIGTTSQHSTSGSQGVTLYDSQTQQPKPLSVQQGSSGYDLSSQTPQNSYDTQNQAAQLGYDTNSQDQVSYTTSLQTPSVSISSPQITQPNAFSLQNSQFGVQTNYPLSYYQYQTAQDFPLHYASLFGQNPTSFLPSSQSVQQSAPLTTSLDQSYSLLQPGAQSLYGSSSGQEIYVNQQQAESSSTEAPSDTGSEAYATYSPDQLSAYPSVANAQTAEKSYPNSQYSYVLQNSQDEQTVPSSDSQSSSAIGSGRLLYASSTSAKQINYSPSSQTSLSSQSQQYASPSYQTSGGYVTFANSGVSSNKAGSQPVVSYGQQSTEVAPQSTSSAVSSGVITPGSTYAKSKESDAKTQETSESSDDVEDSEYDEDDENTEEDASYKVVYIPLDILKNILSNSVENTGGK